jgi:hypothetical protein
LNRVEQELEETSMRKKKTDESIQVRIGQDEKKSSTKEKRKGY